MNQVRRGSFRSLVVSGMNALLIMVSARELSGCAGSMVKWGDWQISGGTFDKYLLLGSLSEDRKVDSGLNYGLRGKGTA